MNRHDLRPIGVLVRRAAVRRVRPGPEGTAHERDEGHSHRGGGRGRGRVDGHAGRPGGAGEGRHV